MCLPAKDCTTVVSSFGKEVIGRQYTNPKVRGRRPPAPCPCFLWLALTPRLGVLQTGATLTVRNMFPRVGIANAYAWGCFVSSAAGRITFTIQVPTVVADVSVPVAPVSPLLTQFRDTLREAVLAMVANPQA